MTVFPICQRGKMCAGPDPLHTHGLKTLNEKVLRLDQAGFQLFPRTGNSTGRKSVSSQMTHQPW
jgi:hypothetical protein